jgi:hypothetical protein
VPAGGRAGGDGISNRKTWMAGTGPAMTIKE